MRRFLRDAAMQGPFKQNFNSDPADGIYCDGILGRHELHCATLQKMLRELNRRIGSHSAVIKHV